jgi:hypothetical protein
LFKINIKEWKMKRSFKIIALAMGLVTLKMGVQAATTAPVDPDAAVYTAFITLGFKATTPVTLPTRMTAANAQIYLDALVAAQKFFAASVNADGTPVAPTTTPLKTYYDNITAWKGAVNTFKTQADAAAAAAAEALANARAALTATAAANYTVPSNLSTQIAKIASQFSALTTDADKTALNSVYNNIKIAYQNLSTQTATTVATYLGNLVTLSGTITTNSTMFEGQDVIKGYASAVTANAAATGITTLLGATMTTPGQIKTALEDTANLGAIKAWRAIKTAITPSVSAQ